MAPFGNVAHEVTTHSRFFCLRENETIKLNAELTFMNDESKKGKASDGKIVKTRTGPDQLK